MEWVLIRNQSRPNRYYAYRDITSIYSLYIFVQDPYLSVTWTKEKYLSATLVKEKSPIARSSFPVGFSIRTALTETKTWATKELASPMMNLASRLSDVD